MSLIIQAVAFVLFTNFVMPYLFPSYATGGETHLSHHQTLQDGEQVIGCGTVGVPEFVLMNELTADGELCRPARFEGDFVFLELQLYESKPAAYPGDFVNTSKDFVAQAIEPWPDTFGCTTMEAIVGYLDLGLSAEIEGCVPMLWADVQSWKSLGAFSSSYCEAYLDLESVEVLEVTVGGQKRWAITDCLDEHVGEIELWDNQELDDLQTELTTYAKVKAMWSQTAVFHRLNADALFQLQEPH